MAGGDGSAKAPSSVEQTPDVFGDGGRVDTVLGMLRNIQSQAFSLDVEVTTSGLGDDAQVPSAPGQTVKERREYLRSAEERLVSKYADLMPEIHERVQAQRKAEAAARASANAAG